MSPCTIHDKVVLEKRSTGGLANIGRCSTGVARIGDSKNPFGRYLEFSWLSDCEWNSNSTESVT